MARVINTGPGDTGAKVAGTAQKRQTRSTTAGAAQATAGPSTAKVPTTGKQATQSTSSVAGPSTGKVPAAAKQAAQPPGSVAGPSTAKVAAPTAAKNGKPKRGRPRTACSPCRRAKRSCPHMREEEEEEEEEEDDDDGQKKLSEKAKGKQKMKRADDNNGDDDNDQKQLSEKAKGKQKRKRADDDNDDDDDDDAPGPKPAKKRGRPAKNQAAVAGPSTVPQTVAGPSGSAPAPAAPADLSNPLTAAGHIVTHQYMSQQLGQQLDEAGKKWKEAMEAMMKAKQALDAWKDFYLKHKGSPS
ncbi:uncharacterized protein BO66DRAFT_442989 [Aspergillus aculeatinus CBS 121060]|uniref:Uncharacterized protein n=1 Tax=Aspergillus aculeatinus CBS 121060 TaxID=1448322 RepID=A0ACD1GVU3_9EURO|nr:hypothetical protein BO66DRAFT_442989 [Aspergillus aculeatinus CBS 121060]RAH65450.1 hypothetical protein BO66DRAFT_442989 [Aspergillus aculeatinus CBS 121060]